AVGQTRTPVWSLLEQVPLIGPNLEAFRQTTELVDAVVRDGIGPLATAANGLTAESLKPTDGRIDLAPLQRLAPAAVQVDDAIQAATRSADAIDTRHVVSQLREPIDELRGQLAEVAPLSAEARRVLPLLPAMLGADEARRYLLMFQNNAEERASGGNPASLALLSVDQGKISLGRQASSTDFPSPYADPPYTPTGPGNEDWPTVYTDYASTYLTNITMTPDFPTTATMARAMWRGEFGGRVDGVISFDPVALSYLLRATGPIDLGDGITIDASNAVSFLLFDVYAKYPDPDDQDKVFAAVARSVFASLIGGDTEASDYLDQLRPMVAEQRLKLWSVHRDEQAVIGASPVGLMLPVDNRSSTVLGVYNNDDATSKMSYFMDQRVSVTARTCGAEPTYTVKATVINTLKRSQVDDLPEYVRAHQKRIPPGGDRQWVQLFGPVGATLESVTIDGEPVVWGTSLQAAANTNEKATGVAVRRPAVQGSMYGRPVGVVSITLGPTTQRTVTAVFTGTPQDSKTVGVSHTPKVRAVPVDINEATCR
ncbi:MAG TPA: DUF4012 domain-containing protein, partial [Microlunatus sp.]|nr:DUF4012 domain-containing protein [Microlunatus sp.]